MSRVLRLRGVDIGLAVYGNDKERVAEAAIQIRRREAKSVPAAARRDGKTPRTEDSDWSLKIEGLRGMLPAVRLAESRGPDGRTKDTENS